MLNYRIVGLVSLQARLAPLAVKTKRSARDREPVHFNRMSNRRTPLLRTFADYAHAMNRDINPYSAPSHVGTAPDSIRRFLGRSIVVGLLAATTLGTGLFLLWLDSIAAIDLGRFGAVALVSLLLATIVLFFSVRCYSLGSRKYAVAFLVIGMLFFVPIVLIAFHEAGIFTLF